MKYLIMCFLMFCFGCSVYTPPPEPAGEKVAVNTTDEIHDFYMNYINEQQQKGVKPVPDVIIDEFNKFRIKGTK